MVERLVRIQEVSGSNPLISTIEKDGRYRKISTVFSFIPYSGDKRDSKATVPRFELCEEPKVKMIQ